MHPIGLLEMLKDYPSDIAIIAIIYGLLKQLISRFESISISLKLQ